MVNNYYEQTVNNFSRYFPQLLIIFIGNNIVLALINDKWN